MNFIKWKILFYFNDRIQLKWDNLFFFFCQNQRTGGVKRRNRPPLGIGIFPIEIIINDVKNCFMQKSVQYIICFVDTHSSKLKYKEHLQKRDFPYLVNRFQSEPWWILYQKIDLDQMYCFMLKNREKNVGHKNFPYRSQAMYFFLCYFSLLFFACCSKNPRTQ